MKAYLIKSFSFSSSYPAGTQVLGRNYRLAATLLTQHGDRLDEWSGVVQREVINPIHSKDLKLHTQWFEGGAITDLRVLEVLSQKIAELAPNAALVRLELQCDASTRYRLDVG